MPNDAGAVSPRARVYFEVEGDIPKRAFDDLSHSIAESMRRSGAEQFDRSLVQSHLNGEPKQFHRSCFVR